MRPASNLLTLLSLLGGLASCTGASNTPGPVMPGPAGNAASNAASNAATAATQPAVAGAAAEPAAPVKITTVEGITEYRLANGMRVLLFPDASQAKVTVAATYFVGSRHEGYGETGMAHLLEHMLFKGTPTRKNIWKSLQDHGARFNGSTWFDRTNYYETMPATPENLEYAIRMEADRMVNSNIAAEELAKEFSVVRNEFEMGENNPQSILMERMLSAAFLWHNYGKSTIGSKSDIEFVPADRLKAFYKKYYRPDNAMLVVAGKFDEAKALALANETFGRVAKPASQIPPTYTAEPQQDGEKLVTLRRPGDTAYVGVLYHGLAMADAAEPSLETAASILTDEPSGALYKKLVKTKLAASVSSTVFPTADPGVVMFFAEVPNTKNLDTVRKLMLSTIEGFGNSNVNAADVARQVRRNQKQIELFMANSQQIAVALSEFGAAGDWRLFFVTRDRVDGITRDTVRKAAAAYFRRDNRTVGLFLPTAVEDLERSPLPTKPDVVALTKDYKGRANQAEGEVFAATFDNIEARTDRSELSNGMKLALLSKRTRGHKVSGQIDIYFGSEKALKGKTDAAAMIADMLIRGSKKHTYQQLKDELDRLKASLSISSAGPAHAVVSIDTKRDQLPEVIALVAEILEQPAFPAAQFAIVKQAKKTALESSLQDPQALAINALRRTFAPYPQNDVRYLPTLPEQIARLDKLKRAQLRHVHSKYWGSASATATFVGDFDGDKLKDALTKGFASWKAQKPYRRIANRFIKNKGGEKIIQTPDKKMAFILAAKTLALRDDNPDYPALVIAGYALGGGGSSRLVTRLRHKGGISYGAFGGIQASPRDKLGAIFGGAILNPDNAEKGMAWILEEFKRLFAEGIPAKELTEAKAAYKKQIEGQLASDSFIIGNLSQGLEIGRTMAFQKKLLEKIAALTPEQVKAAIGRHLNVDRLTLIKAGDFTKKAAAKK